MAYKKIEIDNPKCSRRFHITFDDEGAKQAKVEVYCPYCNVVVMSEENHPLVKLARQENLVKTAELSPLLMTECQFEDQFEKIKVIKTVARPLSDPAH